MTWSCLSLELICFSLAIRLLESKSSFRMQNVSIDEKWADPTVELLEFNELIIFHLFWSSRRLQP